MREELEMDRQLEKMLEENHDRARRAALAERVTRGLYGMCWALIVLSVLLGCLGAFSAAIACCGGLLVLMVCCMAVTVWEVRA